MGSRNGCLLSHGATMKMNVRGNLWKAYKDEKQRKQSVPSLKTGLRKTCSSFALSGLGQGKREGSQTPKPLNSCCFFSFHPKTKTCFNTWSWKDLENRAWEKKLIAFFKSLKAASYCLFCLRPFGERKRKKDYHYFYFASRKTKVYGYYCLSLKAYWSRHQGQWKLHILN